MMTGMGKRVTTKKVGMTMILIAIDIICILFPPLFEAHLPAGPYTRAEVTELARYIAKTTELDSPTYPLRKIGNPT
jgi:hypothetical protein